MNERNFISPATPETGMAPGHSASNGEPDWLARDRALTDMATRYARLMAWIFALSTAFLFFSIAVSVASIEFGIVPPGDPAGEPMFPGQSMDLGGAPPDVAP